MRIKCLSVCLSVCLSLCLSVFCFLSIIKIVYNICSYCLLVSASHSYWLRFTNARC